MLPVKYNVWLKEWGKIESYGLLKVKFSCSCLMIHMVFIQVKSRNIMGFLLLIDLYITQYTIGVLLNKSLLNTFWTHHFMVHVDCLILFHLLSCFVVVGGRWCHTHQSSGCWSLILWSWYEGDFFYHLFRRVIWDRLALLLLSNTRKSINDWSF